MRRWILAGAGLVAAQCLLLASGRGALAGPPVAHLWTSAARWAGARPAELVAVAALRDLALLLGWYLLGAWALGCLARLSRWPIAAAVARALTPAVVARIMITGSLSAPSATLVSTTAMSATVASRAQAGGRPAPALIVRLPAGAATPPTPASTPHAGGDVAGGPDSVQISATPIWWRVESGDNLWSISARTLASQWDRGPTDQEIEPYWRVVIEMNRARLVDGNPDLIFPGQLLSLPEPPPRQ